MARRKGVTLDFLEFQLFRIGRALEKIFRKVDEMSEGQAALDSAIQDLKAQADQILGVVEAIITKLSDVPSAPDFTNEVQTLQAITGEVGQAVTEAKAAVAPPAPPAEPPPTPVTESTAEPGSGEAPPEPPPTGQ